MPIPAHMTRVATERDELKVKLDALDKFIGGNPIFPKLPAEEQYRLLQQQGYMRGYYETLCRRLESMPASTPDAE